jgi:hypothetical protein
MCRENRSPITLNISIECYKILKEFKEEMLIEYKSPASNVGQPTMLLRAAENSLRLFAALSVYKKWHRSSNNYLASIEKSGLDDEKLLRFCIGLARNNIKVADRALKEVDDVKDNPYSAGIAKLIKAIRESAIDNFDYKRVSELRSIRTILREMLVLDMKANKKDSINTALSLMLENGLLTKKGNKYAKVN